MAFGKPPKNMEYLQKKKARKMKYVIRREHSQVLR